MPPRWKLIASKTLHRLGYALCGLSLVLFLNFSPATARSPVVPSSRDGVVQVQQLWQQGRDHYQSGQFAAAISPWQQVAQIYQEQGDPLNQAVALGHLSSAYQQLGEWSKAQAAIEESLALLKTQPEARSQLAQALNTQGSLQLAQANPESALKTWQQATQIYAEVGDLAGQVGSLVNQAQAQQVLGFYLRARKTLETVKEALAQQSDLELKATGLRNLGDTLRLVGDFEQSRTALLESFEIAQNLENAPLQEVTQLSLGNTAYAQQQLETALEHYQAAARSPQSTLNVQAQLNQFKVLLDQGNLPLAEALWPQLQTQIAALPTSRETVYSQINLGRGLVRLKKDLSSRKVSWRHISQLMATAVQQAQQLSDPRAQSYALGYLGQLYEQTQQWSSAEDLTQQALTLAQGANAADISYQWYWQQGRIAKAKGNLTAATTAYEDAFNTLQDLRSDLVAINPDVQFSFQQTVEPVYRDLVDLLLRPQVADQDHIGQARDVIEALQVVELENFFRSACLEGQRVAVDRIDQEKAAVLYPILLGDRIEVILSLPNRQLRHYPIAVADAEVEQTITEFRRFLEKPYTAPEGKQLGQTVYQWLIQPAEQELAQAKIDTLVFVLDGSLRNIPMAALYDGQKYLIERYSIALTPGLQLLNPRPLDTRNLRILAGGLAESRHGFPPLANVPRELEQIEATASGQILLDQGFTIQALRDQIQSLPFPIVHLATHGEFSSNANGTFIVAYDQLIPINEFNDLLRTSEQLRRNPIELLVLSACKTAAGDKKAALGLAGVAVQAGARSTLASLWYLDDESGAQFIGEFYRALSEGTTTKAEAVRQAQLALLRNPDHRQPANWAPYVLVGNWL